MLPIELETTYIANIFSNQLRCLPIRAYSLLGGKNEPKQKTAKRH